MNLFQVFCYDLIEISQMTSNFSIRYLPSFLHSFFVASIRLTVSPSQSLIRPLHLSIHWPSSVRFSGTMNTERMRNVQKWERIFIQYLAAWIKFNALVYVLGSRNNIYANRDNVHFAVFMCLCFCFLLKWKALRLLLEYFGRLEGTLAAKHVVRQNSWKWKITE